MPHTFPLMSSVSCQAGGAAFPALCVQTETRWDSESGQYRPQVSHGDLFQNHPSGGSADRREAREKWTGFETGDRHGSFTDVLQSGQKMVVRDKRAWSQHAQGDEFLSIHVT